MDAPRGEERARLLERYRMTRETLARVMAEARRLTRDDDATVAEYVEAIECVDKITAQEAAILRQLAGVPAPAPENP